MEGLEDLLSFHRFVKSSKDSGKFQSKKKQVESEILGHAFANTFTSESADDFSTSGRKLKKKTLDVAGQIVNSK